MSRRLGITMSEVELQETETSDLHLSTLHKWSHALDVPLTELLLEPDEIFSPLLQSRAQMLHLMKMTKVILESAKQEQIQLMARMMVEQLVEVMPELRGVGAWPSVGQRRGVNELGRIARIFTEDILTDPRRPPGR